jgi:multicomponent Na+:H+ antiporter subunit G
VTIREAATVVLMVVGAVLTLLAALGMVRMPDLYSRMQSATKASTLGVGCTMLAVAIDFADLAITTRVVLIVAFVFLTAPISAHMIGRAAYYVGVPLWKGTTLDELHDHNGRQAPAPERAPERG